MGCPKLLYYPRQEGLEKSTVIFLGGQAKKEVPRKNCYNYYPFGLTFNSYQRAGAKENKYLYNEGSERITDLDLGVDMTKYRVLDPAIGRWWQVDPKADKLESLSPYNSMFNNPIRYNDPLGDCPPGFPCDFMGGLVEKATNYVTNKVRETVVAVGNGIVNEVKEFASSIETSPYVEGEAKVTIGGRGALKGKGIGVDANMTSVDLVSGSFEIDGNGTSGDLGYILEDGNVNTSAGLAGGDIVEGGFSQEKTIVNSTGEVLEETKAAHGSIGFIAGGSFTAEQNKNNTTQQTTTTVKAGAGADGAVGIGIVVEGKIEVGIRIQYKDYNY